MLRAVVAVDHMVTAEMAGHRHRITAEDAAMAVAWMYMDPRRRMSALDAAMAAVEDIEVGAVVPTVRTEDEV